MEELQNVIGWRRRNAFSSECATAIAISHGACVALIHRASVRRQLRRDWPDGGSEPPSASSTETTRSLAPSDGDRQTTNSSRNTQRLGVLLAACIRVSSVAALILAPHSAPRRYQCSSVAHGTGGHIRRTWTRESHAKRTRDHSTRTPRSGRPR